MSSQLSDDLSRRVAESEQTSPDPVEGSLSSALQWNSPETLQSIHSSAAIALGSLEPLLKAPVSVGGDPTQAVHALVQVRDALLPWVLEAGKLFGQRSNEVDPVQLHRVLHVFSSVKDMIICLDPSAESNGATPPLTREQVIAFRSDEESLRFMLEHTSKQLSRIPLLFPCSQHSDGI